MPDPSRCWTPETIAPLLERWDERVRSEVSRFRGLREEAAASDSVLRAPATEDQIQAVEERLGVRLPSAYRSFLLVSNGAYASTLGAEEGSRRHGFLPVEEIAYAAEADTFYVSIWTSDEVMLNPANDVRPPPEKGVDVGYFAPMREALSISRPHEVFRDMLVPRAGEAEWELWACAKEYSLAYRSFADFLLAELNRRSSRPDRDQTDTYVAELQAGKLWRLTTLAELDDPRTGELAVALLEQDTPPVYWAHGAPSWERERGLRAAHVLGLLRDARHIAPLRSAYQRSHGMDMRRATLVALDACGAPDAFELLSHAAREDEYDDVRFSAVTRLAEHHGQAATDVLVQVAEQDRSEKVKSRAREYLARRDDAGT